MSFSIGKFVPKLLRANPEIRFTARQIAEWIVEEFPKEVETKRENSRAKKLPLDTTDAMVQQIVAEIGAQRPSLERKHPNIKTTEGRPRKYYWTAVEDDTEQAEKPTIVVDDDDGRAEATKVLSEHDLYPLLTDYLKTEAAVYSKRIDEKKSKNTRGRGGNKWLFPDLVGMQDLSANWSREIVDTAKEYSDKKTKLWSFEVKLLLNSSNVRESYFQAVSNSSWANVGYLVASEIQGTSTLRELQVLSNSHGIGVIRLDTENINESQILIPSKESANVDWDAANRLVEENTDFVGFIRLVRQFYQTGDPRPKDWD